MATVDFSTVFSGQSCNLETLLTLLTGSLGTYNLALIPGNTGWVNPELTATYVGGFSFSVPGNYTAVIPVGTKFLWTQTTDRFGVLKSSSFASGNTTFVLIPNDTYPVANAAISNFRISYSDNPYGFPPYFLFTNQIAFTGFSANPTVVGMWTTRGRWMRIHIFNSSSGTSNSIDFQYSIPITVASITGVITGQRTFGADNGTNENNVYSYVGSGSTTIVVQRNGGLNAFTASGAKGANVIIEAPF